MNVVIRDLRDGSRTLDCALSQWHPTVELLRSFNLIEEERLSALADGIGEFSEEEAHQLAVMFEVNVLPRLTRGEEPIREAGGSSHEQNPKNTAARMESPSFRYIESRSWLLRFFSFCRTSAGIRIF